MAAGLVLAFATVLGIAPTRKLIEIQEAKHELKQGSAGWLRTLAGWSLVIFWLAAVWFAGTVIGDWGRSGDIDFAMGRAMQRLAILIEILAAVAD
ncbi:MAG: hypothetical protein AAFO93_05725 [Pseudomonadota bacterium]